VAGYHADAGRWDEALSCYRQSLKLFSDVGETHNRAQILFNMALVHKDQGDLAEACELLTQAMEIFERLGAVPCIAQVDLTFGVILGLQGRLNEANCRFDKAINSQEALEALPELCEAYLSRAQLMAREGRLVEAEFYLGRAQTLISRADCQILNILLFQVQGGLHLKKGRTDQAKEYFEMALASSRSLASPYEEAKALASLGRLALQIKEYPEAEARLEQALCILRSLGAALDIRAIYGDLQRLFMARGDCIRAEEMAALEKDCACMPGCLEKKTHEPMAALAARSPLLIGKLG
jgi:tetratricopeptide (TPR) repeat protein